MNILLKNLTLRNFKGIRNLDISFTHETNIFGQNASGKTTVFDAFNWLLFGKDSSDRKDFNVKTLGTDNEPLHKLEHEVSGTLSIDGSDILLRRVYLEKWVTKRGESEKEFSGHETKFFYNDVPVEQGEYQEKIGNILKESIFKLITNALYFNTMPWQDRRSVLMQLAGPVQDADVIQSLKHQKVKGDFDSLLLILGSGKSIDEYKRELAARKKTIRDELILIPSRLDEVKRQKPQGRDFASIENKIESIQAEINEVDKAVSDKNAAFETLLQANQSKQELIHKHKTRRQEITFETKQKINSGDQDRQNERYALTSEKNRLETAVANNDRETKIATERLLVVDGELNTLRAAWTKINGEELTFDGNAFCCPACKREFEADDIAAKKAELTENFTSDKNARLTANMKSGQSKKQEKEDLEKQIHDLTTAYKTLSDNFIAAKQKLAEFDSQAKPETASIDELLAANDEYVQLGSMIVSLESELQQAPKIDDAELKQKRNELIIERDNLKLQLNDRLLIERSDARIAELERQEKEMAQQIASLEQTEFAAANFVKAKMNIITSRINGLFKFVTFKVFEAQINGGEKECCETLINGVPFSDANNAARINAGIDIINALCEYYQVWAPIFIDNRESVTTLIKCESQVVNLIVREGVKLSVGTPEPEAAMAY